VRVFKIFVLLLVPLLLQASWEILDLPTDRGFTAIWAINEQHIFVGGHEGLWKTFDGENWSLDTMKYIPGIIYFVDDTLGFTKGFDLPAWLYRSVDGGRTWNAVQDETGDSVHVGQIYFPKGQSFIGYGITFDTFYRTENGGLDWGNVSVLPDVYPSSEEIITARGICFPSDPDTGYLPAECIEKIPIGGGEYDYIQRDSYFKTTDGGKTWVLNEEGLWNDNFIPGLVDFPQNASVGYMAGTVIKAPNLYVGYVYKTTDGGATWDTVLKDLPHIASICFPENDQVGYVFGDSLAHKTTDGGKTWKVAYLTHDSVWGHSHFLNNNVGFVTGKGPEILLASMPYYPGFVLKTTDGLLEIAEEDWVDVQPSLLEVSAPSIFANELVLRYQAREPGQMRASVFDASGREVQSLDWRNVNYGAGSMSFNGTLLPSGVYFIRVEFSSAQGNENQTLRAVKVR